MHSSIPSTLPSISIHVYTGWCKLVKTKQTLETQRQLPVDIIPANKMKLPIFYFVDRNEVKWRLMWCLQVF